MWNEVNNLFFRLICVWDSNHNANLCIELENFRLSLVQCHCITQIRSFQLHKPENMQINVKQKRHGYDEMRPKKGHFTHQVSHRLWHQRSNEVALASTMCVWSCGQTVTLCWSTETCRAPSLLHKQKQRSSQLCQGSTCGGNSSKPITNYSFLSEFFVQLFHTVLIWICDVELSETLSLSLVSSIGLISKRS
jgi:hypothetical protein